MLFSKCEARSRLIPPSKGNSITLFIVQHRRRLLGHAFKKHGLSFMHACGQIRATETI